MALAQLNWHGHVTMRCAPWSWPGTCPSLTLLLFCEGRTWVNYTDLTRPHPIWFMWGIAPQPPSFRLVKYYNSPSTAEPVMHQDHDGFVGWCLWFPLLLQVNPAT